MSASLEEVMQALILYGEPRVGVYGDNDTWVCSCKLRTNKKFAACTVDSDYNKHKTPLEAANVCYERVLDAVGTLEFKQKN